MEAALRSKQLRVYAVEHGEEACGLIAENASRAGVKNLVVVKGGGTGMSWRTPGADARVHRRKRRQAAGDSSGTPGEKSERARCLKCRLA